jgi:hypothetical protein
MHPGLLKSIHGRLAGFVKGFLSWGHCQLDQLLDTPAWRSRVVVDFLVPFARKCAKIFKRFLIRVFYLKLLIIWSFKEFDCTPFIWDFGYAFFFRRRLRIRWW